jgi:endonuclease/exonuclease/phosphatase family metal-dependent hydrolase
VARIEVGEREVIAVVAVLLAVLAVPSLAARAAGGRAPGPLPQLAALAPVATLPAVAAVAVAAAASWWLALLLAVPAATLLAWQAPAHSRPGRPRPGWPRPSQRSPGRPRTSRHRSGRPGSGRPRRAGPGKGQAAPGTQRRGQIPAATQPGPTGFSLRILTLNIQNGSADPAAVIHGLDAHQVDVLAVQELTPEMVDRLATAGIAGRLGFSHLDPRPRSVGTGLWARWPMTALPPLPGMWAAAPRARIDPWGFGPVTLAAVHVLAPVAHHAGRWQQDLALIRAALDGGGAPQVLAGDFNASRDHRPFRDLLAAGFADCADIASKRGWPAFTWPAGRIIPPVMRLDHVLVSGTGITVSESRVIRVGRTDHRAVLAVVEVAPPAREGPGQPRR